MVLVGYNYIGSFCNLADVKLIARIGTGVDIDDGTIGSIIDDTSYLIRSDYGDPVKRTWTYIQYSGVGSLVYDFTGDGNRDVYQIVEVRRNNTEVILTGSYVGSLHTGFVTFGSDFLGSFDGDRLSFHWVPREYHVLAKYMAAEQVLMATRNIDGGDQVSVFLGNIQGMIGSIKAQIAPRGLYGTNQFANYDETSMQSFGNYIYQKHWYE